MEDYEIGIRLKNVVWVCLVVVGDELVYVNIGFYDEDGGYIFYWMYGELEFDDVELVVYNQGIVELM